MIMEAKLPSGWTIINFTAAFQVSFQNNIPSNRPMIMVKTVRSKNNIEKTVV